MKWYRSSKLVRFLSISLLTFVILFLIFSGLPAILLILNVPSFQIGRGVVWILRWQNEADGFYINFHLTPLILIALTVGLLIILVDNIRNQISE